MSDCALDGKCSFNNSLSSSFKADIILAMDVLEHIQDDYSNSKNGKTP
jgi:2-polyprenyl-3-methyl-5-hydroxy-6-metoxy-1,4-benzoquinol methylase